MPDWPSGVVLYGTEEAPAGSRRIRVGNLTFDLEDGSARAISWHGVEVVRAIGCPIRDGNWGTLAAEGVEETVDETPDKVTIRRRFAVGDGALVCDLAITADAAGTLRATLGMTAVRDFATNRAGFSVLHPIAATAGTPLAIRHSDGSTEQSVFPAQISPSQPAFDITGLAHEIDGVAIDLAFDGEIFEMEDQRNWTDASHKTYCRPLSLPFPYTIAAGETVTQSIGLSVSGAPSGSALTGDASALQLAPDTDHPMPTLALALEPGWQPTGPARDRTLATGIGSLQVRTGPEHDADYLAAAATLAGDLGAVIDVELVLADGIEPDSSLAVAAIALSRAGIAPARVMALPEPYLTSYQPDGKWPDGPVPDAVAGAVRSAFPDVQVGAGVLTNFTELNRCRPSTGVGDYVTHGTCAIVHAADDRSVIETLEALPQVLASASALTQDRALRLGLVAIGARSNPYGASVTDNDDQMRRALALADPRQRGLFAAAWAVGAVAATAGQGVEAMALGAPSGPFGLVAAPTPWSQPGYDADPEAAVYPLYHLARALAPLSGAARLSVSELPAGVVATGARLAAERILFIANLGEEPALVRLPRDAQFAVLDETSFVDAIHDPDWLETVAPSTGTEITLQPLATAFVRIEGAG